VRPFGIFFLLEDVIRQAATVLGEGLKHFSVYPAPR
jgi:hypothetical protein